MTEILVWRLVGEGGAACWMGLKKDWAMSRPSGPREDAEELFSMRVMREMVMIVFVWLEIWSAGSIGEVGMTVGSGYL